jgi:hypothetical protein
MGGIRGVLAEVGFQLTDARLQGHILRTQSRVVELKRRQLLQEWRWVRSR